MQNPPHTAKKTPQRKTPRIDSDAQCRRKAKTWAKDEDAETREAVFHYLLIRARCQRHGKVDVLQHVNNALKLYAAMAAVRQAAV